MAYSIPFYEKLEERLGKETAAVVTKELRKKLASKYDIQILKTAIEGKIEKTEAEIKSFMLKTEKEFSIIR